MGLSSTQRMQIDLFYGVANGEKIEDLKAFIEYYILKTAESDPWLKDNPPEVKWFGWKCEPSETHPDHPSVNMMRRYLREIVGIAPPLLGTPSFGDMRWIIRYANTPAIQFGPRGGSLHGADEWVNIEDLITAIKIMALTIMDFCGYERG